MKILVLGAGVIGVTTAYRLGDCGHQVTVIDRASNVAQGASHANGAQLTYSYAEPFAAPETLKKMPGYLLGKDPGIGLRLNANPVFYRWGMSFVRNCTHAREVANLHAMLTLSARSFAAMQKLIAQEPAVAAGHKSCGKLLLTRTKDELLSYGALAKIKQSYGLAVEMLDKQACLTQEPALADWQGNFSGGLYAKGDSVIEPVGFCKNLQKAATQKYAVSFKFDHDILRLQISNGQASGVITDKGVFSCDAVIVCLGNGANDLLKPLKDRQNIYPMQGYSLTLPLGSNPPSTSITDPKNKFVFANIGNKIRIAGLLDANLPAAGIACRGQHLLDIAQKMWPDAADYSAPPNLWSGQRPMTPSSLPIVRKAKIPGLFYNIGHGSMGLTMGAGCADIIASFISGITEDGIGQH